MRGVDGVETALGDTSGFAQIVSPSGKVVETSGAPTLGGTWLGKTPLNPYVLQDGAAPAGPGQVLIDETTAEDNDLAVGDRIQVLTQNGPLDETISGLVSFGESGSLAGATVTLFDPQTAQAAAGRARHLHRGPRPRRRLGRRRHPARPGRRRCCRRGPRHSPAQQLADADSGDIKNALSFFSTFLLVFAVIAVFVGAFIIFNTFSMLVAQRSRELALLRALGASRRQVNRAVILEAAAVGVIGSTIGLGLGVLLSFGLQQLIGHLPGRPADRRPGVPEQHRGLSPTSSVSW